LAVGGEPTKKDKNITYKKLQEETKDNKKGNKDTK
jgi:hypothetical protein